MNKNVRGLKPHANHSSKYDSPSGEAVTDTRARRLKPDANLISKYKSFNGEAVTDPRARRWKPPINPYATAFLTLWSLLFVSLGRDFFNFGL